MIQTKQQRELKSNKQVFYVTISGRTISKIKHSARTPPHSTQHLHDTERTTKPKKKTNKRRTRALTRKKTRRHNARKRNIPTNNTNASKQTTTTLDAPTAQRRMEWKWIIVVRMVVWCRSRASNSKKQLNSHNSQPQYSVLYTPKTPPQSRVWCNGNVINMYIYIFT